MMIGKKYVNKGWHYEVVGKRGSKFLVHCQESNHTFAEHGFIIREFLKGE